MPISNLNFPAGHDASTPRTGHLWGTLSKLALRTFFDAFAGALHALPVAGRLPGEEDQYSGVETRDLARALACVPAQAFDSLRVIPSPKWSVRSEGSWGRTSTRGEMFLLRTRARRNAPSENMPLGKRADSATPAFNTNNVQSTKMSLHRP